MVFFIWFFITTLSVVSCTFNVELEGSEDAQRELEEKILNFHNPFLPHLIAPIIQHPWVQKLAFLPQVKLTRSTVTRTKTVVLETVKKETRHYVCYKAPPGLHPCLHEDREGSAILPTAVPKSPQERETRYLGVLEGSELRDENQNEQLVIDEEQLNMYSPYLQSELNRQHQQMLGSHQQQEPVWDDRRSPRKDQKAVSERDRRTLKNLFRSVKYVTKTLWVTRVEDYIDTGVTATLWAANCIPTNSDMRPCPEKVEHYIHYDVAHQEKPIIEKEKKINDFQRRNDKEGTLERRDNEEEYETTSDLDRRINADRSKLDEVSNATLPL